MSGMGKAMDFEFGHYIGHYMIQFLEYKLSDILRISFKAVLVNSADFTEHNIQFAPPRGMSLE